MFTFLITDIDSKEDITLTKAYRHLNSKIIHLNIDNIDHLIIDCKNQDFLKHKLKLINVSKENQNLNTYPNLDNFFQRNFLFGEESLK